MPTSTSFEREKREVEAILGSGIFSRAPNLALLLGYVCRKYFDGQAGDIKEYNIGVEALGRPEAFDQKRDSIVRVEAHRLRKRLREYYEGEGAEHEIHIEIPSGQYTPHFVFAALPEIADVLPEPPPPTEIPDASVLAIELIPHDLIAEPTAAPLPATGGTRLSQGRGPAYGWLWATVIVALMVAAGAIILVARERFRAQPGTPELAAMRDASSDVRILAGLETGSYVDAFERTWQSDRYYTGGLVTQTARIHPVIGTRDHRIYQTRREGGFRYDIPLLPGNYQLKLYFAETVYGDNNVAGGGETTRIFDVALNGRPLLSGFDVINDAGPAVADIKVFKDVSPGPDGKLHLDFSSETNPAFVNAIEIVPMAAGRMSPVRIVARDTGLKDSQNHYWDPDRYAQGGQVIARPESSVRDPEPELFRSERFGNISYTIPVAQPGRYGITLYFAENWFGPGNPGGGGVGSRVFDILINGVSVRRNFDIFKEAGGVGHAAVVTLHGVEPNHQGKLVIALTPARNYACINALEIIDESK